MIYNVLMHLGIKNTYDFVKKWDIHIWSLKDTNPLFFEHIKSTSGQKINTNMASGVTGMYRIDLYLKDSDNMFVSRENSDRVQHELCHAVLLGKPYMTSAVHDNVNRRFKIHFWYWNRFRWSKFQLSIIDVRQFVS